MVKFKVVQEYPVSVKDFVACLPELPPEKEPKKTLKKNRTSVAIGRTKTAAKKS
jgi:hypothetical protein